MRKAQKLEIEKKKHTIFHANITMLPNAKNALFHLQNCNLYNVSKLNFFFSTTIYYNTIGGRSYKMTNIPFSHDGCVESERLKCLVCLADVLPNSKNCK